MHQQRKDNRRHHASPHSLILPEPFFVKRARTRPQRAARNWVAEWSTAARHLHGGAADVPVGTTTPKAMWVTPACDNRSITWMTRSWYTWPSA